MAISYVRIKRMIFTGANPGEKYLARIFRGNDVSLDQLAMEITESTTVSYPDVLACLKALEINVSRHILNGSAVKFGLLGSFIPAIKATAKETLEEVTVDTILKARCRFYPSPTFMNSLEKSKFILKDLSVNGLQEPPTV